MQNKCAPDEHMKLGLGHAEKVLRLSQSSPTAPHYPIPIVPASHQVVDYYFM